MPRFRIAACNFELFRIDIRPNYSSLEIWHSCQFADKIVAAAANVPARRSRAEAGALQKSVRGRLHDAR